MTCATLHPSSLPYVNMLNTAPHPRTRTPTRATAPLCPPSGLSFWRSDSSRRLIFLPLSAARSPWRSSRCSAHRSGLCAAISRHCSWPRRAVSFHIFFLRGACANYPRSGVTRVVCMMTLASSVAAMPPVSFDFFVICCLWGPVNQLREFGPSYVLFTNHSSPSVVTYSDLDLTYASSRVCSGRGVCVFGLE